MLDLQPGRKVTWLHCPRGGWGYIFPVDAEIVKASGRLVRIRVQKKSGEMVERVVRRENLRGARNA